MLFYTIERGNRMQVAFNGQQLASTEAFMQELEKSRSYEGVKAFFT